MKLKRLKILRHLGLTNFSLFWEKISRNITKEIKPYLFGFRKNTFKPENAIIIFSEARGGSTWIMNILQKNFNSISVFEPLSYNESARNIYRKTKFSFPLYFGEKGSDLVLKNFLDLTLQGKETNSRTLQFNTVKELLVGEKMIVKMINVNLIAPWLADNFKLNYKPLYVVRHPLAIHSSREKYSGQSEKKKNERNLGKYNRKRLVSDSHPYNNYLDELDGATTKFSRYVTEWCIRNKDFVQGKYNDKYQTVYYEDMVLNPQQILKQIEKEWSLEKSLSSTSKESGTTAIGERVLSGEKQLSKWRDYFSEEEKENAQEILDHFDIECYSAYSPFLKNT
jgi:hypothetical protein